MNKPGFTLLELQVSLLLTIAILGALFLFSFYFWQNHHQRTALLSFHREADIFFDWHHQRMREVLAINQQGRKTLFTGLGLTVQVLDTMATGPVLDGLQFFNDPVQFESKYTLSHEIWQVSLSIKHPQLNVTRTWKGRYPKLPPSHLEALQ